MESQETTTVITIHSGGRLECECTKFHVINVETFDVNLHRGGLGTKKSGEHQSHYDLLSGNLKCLFGANSSSWCRDISVDK